MFTVMKLHHQGGGGEASRVLISLPTSSCPSSAPSPPSLQLVSDTRRISDIQWFQEVYGTVTQTVRVVASEQSRQQRGWAFTPGVDDAESECGLDNFGSFDWVIENHGDEQSLENQLQNLLEFIHTRL